MLLQAIGVFLQGANAQIALLTHSASLAVLLTSAIGAYQWYVQKLGNDSMPAPIPGTSQTIQTVETIQTTQSVQPIEAETPHDEGRKR